MTMKKQNLILNENEFKQFIYAATKDVIAAMNEATIKQASSVAGINAMATRDYHSTHSVDSKSKMNRADLLRLPLLTKAIIDKFGKFKIEFVEYNNNNKMTYVNSFVFDCIVLIDNDSCIMKGEIAIGSRPYSVGYIRYIFSQNKWHRVMRRANLRVSEIAQLEPFHANLPLVNNITSTLQDFINLESQNITTAQNVPLIQSKSRKPLSTKSKINLYGDYLNAYNKKKAITPDEII